MGEEMLKEVLKAISEGNSTIADISKAAQMKESAVINAVSELKRMGYLEGSICSMDKPSCKNCPLYSAGSETIFRITEKGMEYLKK